MEVGVEVGIRQEVLRPDMIEVCPFCLEHLNQFAVLVVKCLHLLLALLFDAASPREVPTLRGEEGDDFEKLCPVVLDEGTRELVNAGSEDVSVEIPGQILNGVLKEAWFDHAGAKVTEQTLIGCVGLTGTHAVC